MLTMKKSGNFLFSGTADLQTTFRTQTIYTGKPRYISNMSQKPVYNNVKTLNFNEIQYTMKGISFIHSFLSFINSFFHSFIRSFCHSFIHSVHSFIHSFIHLLSPPVLMHGGLLCIAFHLSVCLSVAIPKVTR